MLELSLATSCCPRQLELSGPLPNLLAAAGEPVRQSGLDPPDWSPARRLRLAIAKWLRASEDSDSEPANNILSDIALQGGESAGATVALSA